MATNKSIIIPGFGMPAAILENFTAQASQKIQVLNLKKYIYLETREQLNKLLEQNETAHLCGWSLGSLFALKYVLEYPEKIKTLLLTGATARFTEDTDYPNSIPVKQVSKMLRLVPKKAVEVMQNFYTAVFQHTSCPEQLITCALKHIPDLAAIESGLKELLDLDVRSNLKKIKAPTMICQGNKDLITPMYGAEFLNKSIKKAKLYCYNGGHCLFLECPEILLELWNQLQAGQQ